MCSSLRETLLVAKRNTWVRCLVFAKIVLLCGGVMGCAAVGVGQTSNPLQKLNDAYGLMGQCRPIPAERLIGKALHIYEEKGDEIGMAEAHHTFGNLYKNQCDHSKYEKYLLETVGSHEKAYAKSEQNFLKGLSCTKNTMI